MLRCCLGVLMLVGCYQPSTEAPCTVRCDSAAKTGCPGDQLCGGDGLCHTATGGCGATFDAAADSTVADLALIDLPAGDGPICFGSGIVRICVPTVSTATTSLPTFIDTGTSTTCSPGSTETGEPVCLVYARTINDTVGVVRVEGPLPLVLVAVETIDLTHGIDVSSMANGAVGAAADAPLCSAPSPAALSGGGGASGAAGGTFQGGGGSGAAAGSTPGGQAAIPGAKPTQIRGGCRGGLGVNGNAVGVAGHGGGAVYLIAGSGIVVRPGALINASGGGAVNGNGSGSGGGSGGLIGLDAAQLQIAGKLFANGGGGSSGFVAGVSFAGGDSAGPVNGGLGGFNSNGGSGGKGSGGQTLLAGSSGAGVAVNFNAGGGGGGAGFILVYPVGMAAAVNGVNTAPPAQ